MAIQSIYTNTSVMASRRYVGINGDKLSVYQEQLSTGLKVADPSKDPSSAAIGYLLDSTLQVLEQATTNANQATAMVQLAIGTLGSTQEILTRMSVLAAQSNSDSIGEAQRTLLNKEYQTLLAQINENAKITWVGEALFAGYAKTLNRHNAQTQSINATQAGTVFTGLDKDNTRGFISGSVNNVSVRDASLGLLQVDMQVDGQTFSGMTSGIGMATGGSISPNYNSGTITFSPNVGLDYSVHMTITNTSSNTLQIADVITLLGNTPITINGGQTLNYNGSGLTQGLSVVIINDSNFAHTFTATSNNATLTLTENVFAHRYATAPMYWPYLIGNPPNTIAPNSQVTNLNNDLGGVYDIKVSAVNNDTHDFMSMTTLNIVEVLTRRTGGATFTLAAGASRTFTGTSDTVDNVDPNFDITITNASSTNSRTFTVSDVGGYYSQYGQLVFTDSIVNNVNTAYTATIGNAIGNITLVNTYDINNQIVLEYNNSSVSTAYNTATTLQKELHAYLGLTIGSPAALQSGSNLIDAATYSSGATMEAGVWSISYTYNSIEGNGTLRLTNGKDTFTSKVEAIDMGNITGTFIFDNGFKVALSNFNGAVSAGMETLEILSSSGRVRSFQIGEKSNDILSMTFNTINTDTLGLTGTYISSKMGAAAVESIVTNAINTINVEIGIFGGKRAQLDAIGKNLELSIKNQTAVKSTFTDTDIPYALMQSQRYHALMHTASSMLQSTLQHYQDLSNMVKQLTRF